MAGTAAATAPVARNPNGAGGGGASDVRVSPFPASDRLLVAGGGGGAGSAITYQNAPHGIPGAGGAGGGTGDGSDGENVSGAWVGAGGGGGGTTTAVGGGGGPSNPLNGLYNGCGIWNPAYPTPGVSGAGATGGSGGYLFGGSGQRCDLYHGWGGGGGGGWYAGGGGGGGITGGAGGGGGSGHAPTGSTSTLGQPGAHGQITISYVAPGDWAGLGGGPMTSAPTAVPRPAGDQPEPTQDVFYLDKNSQVIQRVVTNGVASPEYNLGAVLYPGSTVAAVWRSDGRLDLFGRGTENALWQKSYTAPGGWGGWIARTSAGTLTSSPSVVSVTAPQLDVFFRGTDNQLTQVTSINGTWTTPKTAPGGQLLASAPSAVVTDAGLGGVDVYAQCGGVLCRWAYYRGGWLILGRPVNSAIVPTSAPSVITFGTDRTQVAVRGRDNHLILWRAESVDWNPTDLGEPPSPAGSSIAMAPMSGTNTILYARGSQGSLTARTIAP